MLFFSSQGVVTSVDYSDIFFCTIKGLHQRVSLIVFLLLLLYAYCRPNGQYCFGFLFLLSFCIFYVNLRRMKALNTRNLGTKGDRTHRLCMFCPLFCSQVSGVQDAKSSPARLHVLCYLYHTFYGNLCPSESLLVVNGIRK